MYGCHRNGWIYDISIETEYILMRAQTIRRENYRTLGNFTVSCGRFEGGNSRYHKIRMKEIRKNRKTNGNAAIRRVGKMYFDSY